MQDTFTKVFYSLSTNSEVLNHSLNTARLCWEASLHLPKGFLQVDSSEIYLAGLLHDIGKTTWPDILFYKKNKDLTKSDIIEMQKHPLVGTKIAKELIFDISDSILSLILTHHEKPNGKGYPYGIKNLDNASLFLSACDIYSACIEKRAYKTRTLTPISAIQIVEEFAPKEIVKAISNCQVAIKKAE